MSKFKVGDTPKEITLNGATYVLKEEPKPEHEWKFGDIASHPDYGVGIVFSEPCEENDDLFLGTEHGSYYCKLERLTFIRRADLSV